MNTSRQFVKSMILNAGYAFVRAGWTKRKANIFSTSLTEEAYGWLGLNHGLYKDGIVQINPVVSSGNFKIEKIVHELLELKFEPYTTACIGANVGYLMPEKKYVTWSFREEGDFESSLSEMVKAVEKFGRPFIERNVSLQAIHNAMLESKRGTPPDPLDYRLAVTFVLLGSSKKAKEFVDARLREIGTRDDEAAEIFRKFAKKLGEWWMPKVP